jgi:hypothetical protein
MTAEHASPARLSYALIIILAFQTLLFTCLLVSFSGFLLLTFFDLTGRVGEIERLAATLPSPPAINIEVQPPSLLPTPTAVDTLPAAQEPVSPLVNDVTPTIDPGNGFMATETATFLTAVATPPEAPATETPPPQPEVATPTPALTALRGVTLHVLQNSGSTELLELRNEGAEIVDVSNWRLVGSVNAAGVSCIIPGAIALPPGGAFQIASGDASPLAQGYQCAEAAIWDDNAETIYLTASDGQTIQVEANFVQPPTPAPETPTPTPALAAPTPSAPNINSVSLTILQHSGESELLELRNSGAETVDISGWRLYGNINPGNACILPDGSSLPPGVVFQITAGDASPAAPGHSCSPTPLWDDNTQTFFLVTRDGQTIQVQANAAQTPTDGATPAQQPTAGATPTQEPDVDTPPAPVTSTLHGITLTVMENSDQFELLELYNVTTETVDISSWQLSGTLNPSTAPCVIPPGSSVPPGSVFQIASGETPLTGPGHTCADTPIWADTGETIVLTASDGQSIEVQASLAPP